MNRSAGLRTEILITISLLMGAALLLGGVLMLRLTEQSLLDQKVTHLRLLTETVARSLGRDSNSSALRDSSGETLLQLPGELQVSGWWLYDTDLQLQASASARAEAVSSVHRQRARLSGQAVELIEFPTLLQFFSQTAARAQFIQPVFHDSQFRGLLEIHYSLDDIRYRLFLSQRMVLLYVALYGIILVFVGYYLLLRNVVRPARNLLQATENVSRGNLETRLTVAGPAEIAQLAVAYNQMVEALQESRSETQEHIATLERTNQELQQARDELIRSEKLASVGQLAAGLAHELGNPLAALIGYLEILKGRLQSADAEVVQCSLVEAERIDYLVRELLNFSRPVDCESEIIDPLTECRKVLVLLANQGVLTEGEVEEQLPAQLPSVRFSANKFQQILVNLLLNAAHACKNAGEVQLKAGQQADSVWFEVIDTGCGIAEEVKNKVFDPFYTTKPPGEGTGLGLAICYRLLEEAGGSIALKSEPGKGTCFRFQLPIFE